MRTLLIAALAVPSIAVAAPSTPGAVARAVADPSRPAEDVARDANRRPAETLAFMGARPGMKVADYIANSGYFTRLLSDVAGPRGHVYAVELNEIVKFANVAKGYAGLKDWAAGRANVTVSTVPVCDSLGFPEKLDLFWIAQNYHDLHDKFLGPTDVGQFNRRVFEALKPGGLYVVLDHSALADAPDDVTETLHRIRRDRVVKEVEAAGFELVGSSDLLANPDDPRTKEVFDDTIRGRTDQFLLKFRKPRR
ncbi:methyltransferase [Sphingomonas sp. CROZ-RG-20F-R02-07]|uniref:class I SAM-dependent methyltransferase n=1 Tax=Sphingomonas sp. CROZ-RG-20F-R02-07 TaxID=2914832 RepID=UPI001F599EFA|nr:methyltransferase [Sphingomonas sp. CROZ-RG-20F-R02-07]